MKTNEKTVKMAARLYECRDTAKRFLGSEYKAKLESYLSNLRKVMDVEGVGAIEALLVISKLPHYAESGFIQMMYMAAVVEIIEPSK